MGSGREGFTLGTGRGHMGEINVVAVDAVLSAAGEAIELALTMLGKSALDPVHDHPPLDIEKPGHIIDESCKALRETYKRLRDLRNRLNREYHEE